MNKSLFVKALLCMGGLFATTAGSCISWDGKVAGTVPVEWVETPINSMAPGAGSALVGFDRAMVEKQSARPAFPLINVIREDFDSTGQLTHPPYRTVFTPVYGPITQTWAEAKSTTETQADARMNSIINAAVQRALQGNQFVPVVGVPVAVSTNRPITVTPGINSPVSVVLTTNGVTPEAEALVNQVISGD